MTDDQHVAAFEDLSLPFDQWTHRAHVKVAFIYLQRYSFPEALDRMRARILAYNAHHNVPDTPTSGYNETTTHAFLHLVAATMQAYGQSHPTPDADTFCNTHPQLMTRHALRLFYSPERRVHSSAKTHFVEPDLAALPTVHKRFGTG